MGSRRAVPPAPAALALVWGLALLLGGCRRQGDGTLLVERVTVAEESVAAAPELGIGAKVFRERVEAALKAAGAQSSGMASLGGATPFRLRAEVVHVDTEAEAFEDGGFAHTLSVQVSMEATRPSADGTLRHLSQGIGHATFDPEAGGEELAESHQRALWQAVDLAAQRLVLRVASNVRPVDALLAQAAEGELLGREAAVDALVERGERRVAPSLVALLGEKDETVRMKAMGEAVELRIQEAVPVLIDMALPTKGEPPPLHLQTQVVYALGAIGGREAEAFLYAVESGHGDGRVREAASEARKELAQAAKSVDAGAPSLRSP